MKPSHPSLYFNNIPVSSNSVRKHLGVLLNGKLSSKIISNVMLNKVKKTISLLHKFQQSLQKQSLITIYKSFFRPHLDYGDIVCDRVFKVVLSLSKKVIFICFNKRTLKMIKNAFFFILRALFILEIFKFLT